MELCKCAVKCENLLYKPFEVKNQKNYIEPVIPDILTWMW